MYVHDQELCSTVFVMLFTFHETFSITFLRIGFDFVMEDVYVKCLEYMDLNLNPKVTCGHIERGHYSGQILLLKTLGPHIIIIIVIIIIDK